MDKMSKADAVRVFGFDPETIGLRHRAWWVLEEVDYTDHMAGAKVGDLIVRARDGGGNEPDMSVGMHPNYRGTACDDFDVTYRYYYFAPLAEPTEGENGHE